MTTSATARVETALAPRDQLTALREELPARVGLTEGRYRRAVDSARDLLTDFAEHGACARS